MSLYDSLGVRKLINAFDTATVYGGSRMSSGVLDAMAEASKCFVDLNELHEKAGRRVAELTRNEAAYITSGAAAGLLLAVAACMTGNVVEMLDRLPDTSGMCNEIILKTSQKIAWTVCARQTGAKLVAIGTKSTATEAELELVIREKTAAILYFAGVFPETDGLPLEKVIEVARRHRIPVIVDAAAQIPPVENFWRFTAMGADLVIFSGGKGLRGPQCSGLILGKKELIAACAANGSPNCRIGRASKIGKEEIAGLLTAVEEFVHADHEQIRKKFEEWIQHLREELSSSGQIALSAIYRDSPGITYPRARLTLQNGKTKAEVVAQLRDGNPSIVVDGNDESGNSILLNFFNLNESELDVVIGRLKEILAGGR